MIRITIETDDGSVADYVLDHFDEVQLTPPPTVTIDHDAPAHAHEKLEALRRAVLDAGPAPELHEKQLAQLKAHWPTLWCAVADMIGVAR